MPQRLSEEYTLELAEEHIANANGLIDKLNEVHTFNQTDVTPNTVAGQTQLYSDAGSGLMSVVNDVGAAGDIAWTTQVTYPANTITAATYQNASGNYTYTANDAVVGACYEIDCWGTGTQGSIGNRQTLAFRVNFGGSALQAVTFGTTAFEDTGNKTFNWRAVARVTSSSIGGSANWFSYLYTQTADDQVNLAPGNNNFATGLGVDGAAGTAIDSTVNQTFKIEAKWGATTGGPSMTSRVAMFRRIA